MKNKLLICTLAYLLICTFSFSQTASPDVIASAGDHFVSPSGSVSWTIGEPVTDTYYGAANILTKGFHQPVTVSLASVEETTALEGMYVYPNPVSDFLTLDFSKLDQGDYIVNFFNATGQLVQSNLIDSRKNGSKEVLDFNEVQAGLYFIKINKVNSSRQIVFRLLKI